jgi:molybdopterin converting factor small subunit
MRVQVQFFGPIRRPWAESEGEVELAGGATLRELLRELGYGVHELRYIEVMVNGERGRPGDPLRDGDRVSLRLLIGGG